MRLALKLKVCSKDCIIPINYQYPLQSWIYKVIQEADANFSTFLHEQGYENGDKVFKFFNFSAIKGVPYQVQQDRLIYHTDTLTIKVSFLLPEVLQKFVIGIFNKQRFSLGDKKSRASFEVVEVQMLPEPEFSNMMLYRASTPVVISKKELTDKYAQYLSPKDSRYSTCFVNHLIEKYKVAAPQLVDDSADVIDDMIDIKWELNSSPRKKGVIIKDGTPQKTQIIGYVYDFELTAPAEIHQMAYNAGFGEKNSLGFGFCQLLN